MNSFKRNYIPLMRILALLIVISSSMMIVMLDVNEKREPWEFVQIK